MDIPTKIATVVSAISFGTCFYLNNESNISNSTAQAVKQLPEVTIREAVRRALLSRNLSSGPVIVSGVTWNSGEEYIRADDNSFVMAKRERTITHECVPSVTKVRARPELTNTQHSSLHRDTDYSTSSSSNSNGLSTNEPPTFTYIVSYSNSTRESVKVPVGFFRLVDESSFSGTNIIPFPSDVLRGETRRYQLADANLMENHPKPQIDFQNSTSHLPEIRLGVQALDLPLRSLPNSAWSLDRVHSVFVSKSGSPPARIEVPSESAAYAYPTVPVKEEHISEVSRPRVSYAAIGEVKLPDTFWKLSDSQRVGMAESGVLPGCLVSMVPIKDSVSKILRSDIVVSESAADIYSRFRSKSWSEFVRIYGNIPEIMFCTFLCGLFFHFSSLFSSFFHSIFVFIRLAR